MVLARCDAIRMTAITMKQAADLPERRCRKGIDTTGDDADGAAWAAHSDCNMVALGFSLRSASDADKRERDAAGSSLAAVAMLEL